MKRPKFLNDIKGPSPKNQGRAIHLVLSEFINDSRVLKECKTVSELGMNVEVIALHRAPLPQTEFIGNVRITRIQLRTRKWPAQFVFQLVKYLELTLSIIGRCLRADFIHCHDLDPLLMAVICKILSAGRITLIYDAHELETEQGTYGTQLEYWFWQLLEKNLLRFVDHFIVVSNSIANEYINRYGIIEPTVILNCPNYKELPRQNLLRKTLKISENTKLFLYQGGLTRQRGIEFLCEAFSQIGNSSIAIVFLGDGPLEVIVKKYGRLSSNIFYHPAVPHDQLLNYTASADCGILPIKKSCLSYSLCLPNKFFEYCMAGLPILSNDLIEIKSLVKKYDNGVLFDLDSPDPMRSFNSAVKQILSLDLKQLGENSRRLARDYNWESQEIKLKPLYDLTGSGENCHDSPAAIG